MNNVSKKATFYFCIFIEKDFFQRGLSSNLEVLKNDVLLINEINKFKFKISRKI